MSPALMLKLMSLTATSPPNCLRMARTSSSAAPRGGWLRELSGGAVSSTAFAPRAGSTRASRRDTSGHRPSGAKRSTSTSTMPNTMIS